MPTWVAPLRGAAGIGIAILCLLSNGIALAADSHFSEDAIANVQEDAASLASGYEINSTVLPDLGEQSTHYPPLSRGAAGNPNSTQHVDVTRWLTPDAGGSFGLSLGMSAPGAGAAPLAADPSTADTSLDLGVRWRSRLEGGRRLDISAWARAPQATPTADALDMIRQTQQPLYGTRMEVQWATAKTRGLTPEFGAVGMQLQGGSRLLLRARKGGPMLYYRAKF